MSESEAKAQQFGRLTKVLHTTTYPALSPTRPEVSQAGKTILITGGSGVIGSNISKAFAEAGAATIVLVARRADAIQKAAADLAAQFAARELRVIGLSCDATKAEDVDRLWKKLEQDGVFVDVLVLASGAWNRGPLLELGAETIWKTMSVNSYGFIVFAEKFYKQAGRDKGKPLSLVEVSTTEIYDFGPFNQWPLYSLSKNSGTLALQLIARDVPAEELQIVSFHPGLIYSPLVGDFIDEQPQHIKDLLEFSDPSLCATYAVWAASSEARFLHGRFAWAAWDIDEVRSGPVMERIKSDPRFLKIGVYGL